MFQLSMIIATKPQKSRKPQFITSRKEILEALINAFVKINMKKMPIFFKDDFTLVAYTTTEADMKKAIMRMPQSQPEVFNLIIR